MTQDPAQPEGQPEGQPDLQPEGEPLDAAPPGGPVETDTPVDVADAVPGEVEAEPVEDEQDDTARQLFERTADLQRLQAEYVNYKRRVDRDRELVRENATFTVLNSLLPVLDDIDRAREHGEVTGGFKAVSDSLDRVVSGLGLVKFGQPGEEFDPHLHEALMHRPDEEATSTSVENVAQAGYRIGERVVRAAKVTVAGPA